MFPVRVIHFVENLGNQVNDRLPKKLKLLIEVLYVLQVKEHVVSFNMILSSSPQRVPSLSYPFPGKFGRSDKGSFTEKAKDANSNCICIAHESTCSNLQYDPYLISVACS